MKDYNFNVKILGNVNLVVPANSYEEAKEKVDNLINDLSISNMENRESNKEDITITSSTVKRDVRRVHPRESER